MTAMVKGTTNSLITDYYLPKGPTGISTRLMKKCSVQNGGAGWGPVPIYLMLENCTHGQTQRTG